MPLTFKSATIEDLPFMVDIYNSIIPLGNVTADLYPITAKDWEPWFNQHVSPLRPIYILEQDGVACGWMSFSDYKNRTAYDITAEISVYLTESFRGKGLAFQFLEKGLKKVKSIGLKNIMAVVYADNTASINLFQKLAFKQWGLLPGVCEVKGEFKDVVILGKQFE